MNEKFEKIKNRLALLLLAFGFIACMCFVLNTHSDLQPSGKRTLLLAHWQGERGCREALDEVIKEYEKIHPDVEVRQQIIVGYTSTFVRWCVTQIIAGTMPDIMEYHDGFRPYLANYFTGLSDYVNKPNPYNKGTEQENIPWKDTFYGGMTGSWEPELLDYFTIPNTLCTMRFYCNRDMFREATGSKKLPETMAEFFAVCEKLKEKGVIPVVAENIGGDAGVYYFSKFFSQMFWTLEDSIDYDHDGRVDYFEYYRGILCGDFGFDTDRMKALMELMRKSADYWGNGANALSYDIAPYLFIQGKGACYSSGTWLGRQMVQSCKFELGNFPFPLIGKDDPTAGKFYCGPWGESLQSPGMTLAVADTPNKDLAIDFLQFLTTRKNNGIFNAGPCWLPSVMGADIPPEMQGFKPLLRGKSIWPHFLSSSMDIEFKRLLQNFTGGSCGYLEFINELESEYMEYAPRDYDRTAAQSFQRLSKLEEIRNEIDAQRHEAVTLKQESPSALIRKLQELYEYQITGLSTICAIRGVPPQAEE